MIGALRMTRVVLDGRNRFTKVVRITQTQKRNARRREKIMKENAAIIREGREALDRLNAKILAEQQAEANAAASTGNQADTK